MDDVLSMHEHIALEQGIGIRLNYDMKTYANMVRQRYPHFWHEEIEILYFHQGSAKVHCGDRTYIARSGDIIFVNSCEVHWIEFEAEEANYDCLIINLESFCSNPPGIYETRYLQLLIDLCVKFENHIREDAVATEHILAICREFRERDFGFELSIKAHVFGLLTHLFRHRLQGDSGNSYNVEYYNRIKPAIKYMKSHLSQPISLDDLAQSCHLSNSHFSRLFRQVMSVSPMQHFAALRLQEVASLLQNSHYSITQIAIMTGFNDMAYLSRKFKEAFGLSPKQFKKMNCMASNEKKEEEVL